MGTSAGRDGTPRSRAVRKSRTPSLKPLYAFVRSGVRREREPAGRAIRMARRAGWSRRALEEAALMLVLYAGYPAALETLRCLNQVWPGRASRSREGGPTRWRSRGAALCRRVYGTAYVRLIRTVRDLHPDLAVWMQENGYGRVLSRRGLSARDRELITVVVLAETRWERQLTSHLMGALRLGARPAQILEAVRASSGAPSADEVRRAWSAAFGSDPWPRGRRDGRRPRVRSD